MTLTEEREIVEAVELCDRDGTLRQQAVGWSRVPVHQCALYGGWGRNKRWDYWCITAEPLVIQLTVLNLDYARMGAVAVFETSGGKVLERTAFQVPGRLEQPDRVGAGPTRFRSRNLDIDVDWLDGATRLRAAFEHRGRVARVDVQVQPARDSLNVVVPFGKPHRFQFTSKQIGRIASGELVIDGKRREVSGHAALDFGRGRWPSKTAWNWGAGAGEVGGVPVALQLGGLWTDGTGMTENGVFVDGRLDKIGDRVRFERGEIWRVRSLGTKAVDLRFKPSRARPLWIAPIVELDLQFGHWSGTVVGHGERIEIEKMFGWAERMDVRW